MGKLVVSLEGVVIKEVVLSKEKTTLGRRPYNDVVIDNLAVSGEHAVLQMVGTEVFLEDLNSTNGTYVNGKAVKKQQLTSSDTVEIGKYKIKYLSGDAHEYEKTQLFKAGTGPVGATPPDLTSATNLGVLGPTMGPASIRVLTGAAAGREVTLTKVVTTVGKPGVQVASITRRPTGYMFAHVDGINRPLVNGETLVSETTPLKNGDVIELAGTQMQFVQA